MRKNQELFVVPGFVGQPLEKTLVDWLTSLSPIWEDRYSKNNPPPNGEWQRRLKRPVYWLGNWQFACLDYYHPPKGVLNRCVRAEGYPDFLARLVGKMETKIREAMPTPSGWHLNTCLINYYGKIQEGEKWKDIASVGEHRDYEPGPVASLSFGESALFQFVKSRSKGSRDAIVWEHWLAHGELQAFGGAFWKNEVFHRVQRVRRGESHFPVAMPGVNIRRINLTFRYVPEEHVIDADRLPRGAQEDILGYVRELSKTSKHFAAVKTRLERTLGQPTPIS